MVELAVRDGCSPPADLPRGECSMTRLADGRIRIDHADPRILISGELLDQINDGSSPWAQIEWNGLSYVGGTLKINGVNQRVVYQITQFLPRIYGYIGEWPD